MLEPTTDEPRPNHWAVTEEFTKNVVTLAAGLLALTVTLASGVIGKATTDTPTEWALYGTGGLSIVAAILGVVAHGLIVRYLKGGDCERSAVCCANSAFTFLLLAGIFFAIYGVLAINKPRSLDAAEKNILSPLGVGPGVEKVLRDMPVISGLKDSKWTVQSLNWNEAAKIFDLVVGEQISSQTFAITLEASSGRITKAIKAIRESPALPIVIDISEAQRRLTNLGYRPGPIDGIMCMRTVRAIKHLQKDNGLPMTGRLDKETVERLGIAKATK